MPRSRVWLFLGLIFLVGAVTGMSLTMVTVRWWLQPPGEQQRRNEWMMRLTHRLDLTADQQAKIQPILTDAETQIQTLHHDEVERMASIIDTANSKISPILTPDQQKQLQEMEAEREKRFGSRMHGPHGDSDGHDGDRHGPPGPGPGPGTPLPGGN